TLFGRNTIAGVINIQRTMPTDEFGGKAAISYAEFDTVRARAVINSGRIGDIAALKGFFFWDDTDGFVDNVVIGGTQGSYRTFTVGGTLLLEPMDDLTAVITYEHIDENGETSVVPTSNDGDLICLQVPVPGVGLVRAFGLADEECNRYEGPAAITGIGEDELYTGFQNIETPVSANTDAIYAELTYQMGDFTLTSVTGYRDTDESVVQDFDASSIDFFDTLRVQNYEQVTQEIRIDGDITPWLNALIGGYYFESSYELDQTTNLGFAGSSIFQRTEGDAEAYAVFGDVKIKPTDRITLGFGGRYTIDEKSLFTNFGLSADGSCPLFLGITEDACFGSEDFEEFTWRGAIDYAFDEDRLAYFSYSRGFRSGGFNGRAGTPTSLGPFEPETVDAYELGFKGDWLDNRLRTNIAIFYTEYDDKQEETVQATLPPFSAINPQETVVLNAATAEFFGVETEISAAVTDDLFFRTSFSFLDAEYESFFADVTGDFVPDDVSALDLRRAPDITWSAGFDYSREIFTGRLDATTTFRFVDEYTTCIIPDQPLVLSAITNDPRCTTDARQNLDATISYTQDFGPIEAKFSAFGRNILNDRGIGGNLPVAGLFSFAGLRPPQQFGGEVQIKF
ncbi:MAG: TonB-dependent receptor, partial [Pseudomonadota bacterium]